VLGGVRGARASRARQLFYWCLIEKVVVEDPKKFESEFHRCVVVAGRAVAAKASETSDTVEGGAK
jgi:hypothetical protein